MEKLLYRADKIRAAQAVRQWTNQQLAEAAGVSVPTVSNVRRGVPVKIQFLNKVITALGLSLHDVTEPMPEAAEATEPAAA